MLLDRVIASVGDVTVVNQHKLVDHARSSRPDRMFAFGLV
jgi:hypothetical protein